MQTRMSRCITAPIHGLIRRSLSNLKWKTCNPIRRCCNAECHRVKSNSRQFPVGPCPLAGRIPRAASRSSSFIMASSFRSRSRRSICPHQGITSAPRGFSTQHGRTLLPAGLHLHPAAEAGGAPPACPTPTWQQLPGCICSGSGGCTPCIRSRNTTRRAANVCPVPMYIPVHSSQNLLDNSSSSLYASLS